MVQSSKTLLKIKMLNEIVVTTIVEFAGHLGIETIAEFVDSEEILDKVTELGIDYSQGFLLGKPERTISL